MPEPADLSIAVAPAMTQLLTGGAERERLRQAAGPVLARYQWRDTAARVLRLVEEAAGA